MSKISRLHIVLWIDDIRNPEDFRKECAHYPNERIIWCKSVYEAIKTYSLWGNNLDDSDITIAEIDMDHDAGDYAKDGGDYIRFLDWLEMTHPRDFVKLKWRFHSMNPVGIQNMLAILRRNGVKC